MTQNVSGYTKAAVFEPGTETEVVVRFSTVAGERGSPDTWRDPRGFAVRFYTSEGNLDIVGNNTPVFFIRDPIKFQNFIRSQKRLAADNLRDARHAMGLLDTVSGVCPSGHVAHGGPRHSAVVASYERLLLAHLHVDQCRGQSFLGEIPLQVRPGHRVSDPGRGRPDRRWDADYHQRDLYEAIERTEFPSWTLQMQIMPFDAAKTYRFNPFDLTKVWPHSDYPLIEVGRLTLNRNVSDYHTEMEQVAFQPNNTVPGTGLSPDKMLLARGFSYADAHRARLGVNYQQIPVNRPRSAVRSYSKDGAMRVDNVADPVYYPNSFGQAPAADTDTYAEQAVWAADGEMVRAAYTLHPEDDDFGQARTLLTRLWTAPPVTA